MSFMPFGKLLRQLNNEENKLMEEESLMENVWTANNGFEVKINGEVMVVNNHDELIGVINRKATERGYSQFNVTTEDGISLSPARLKEINLDGLALTITPYNKAGC